MRANPKLSKSFLRNYECYIAGVFMLAFLNTFSNQICAQTFHLIDINKSTDANPNNINDNLYSNYGRNNDYAVLNGVCYFSAEDGVHGRGLWRSDGTSSGTYQIKEGINPGHIIVSNGTLFFAGPGEVGLWKSDGTEAGTKPVLNAIPAGVTTFYPSDLTDLNGTVYFSVNERHYKNDQLWKTDGTASGTVLVKDFNVLGSGNYSFFLHNITAVKNKLYFCAYSSSSFSELWVSDGSATGTSLVSSNLTDPAQIIAGSPDISDSSVYFTASPTQYGTRNLYVTNGEPGSAKIAPGFNGVDVASRANQYIVSIGGVIYFTGYNTHISSNLGLYKYDINNSSAGIQSIMSGAFNISNLSAGNGTLFFNLYDTAKKKYEFWSLSTANSEKILLKDSMNFTNSVNINEQQYFTCYDIQHGTELWKSDGTVNGTTIIKDINPGINSSDAVIIGYANNKLLLSATDGVHGSELWQSDVTGLNTFLLKDINQTRTSSSSPLNLKPFKNGIIFIPYDSNGNPNTVLKSDGTIDGTTIINDTIYNYNLYNAYFPAILTTKNNEAFYWGRTQSGKQGLVKTDGTSAGTVLVNEFTGTHISITQMMATDSLLFFRLVNDSGDKIWRTDGTEANTFIIKNNKYIRNNFSGAGLAGAISTGNSLFFILNGDDESLWISDGTINGTHYIKDVIAEARSMTAHKGSLFFSAWDGISNKLWKSDGSPDGTIKVTENLSSPSLLISYNNELFFSATDDGGMYGHIGSELYKTDGTPGGTVLVKDIHPGSSGSYINTPIILNGILYFFTNGSTTNIVELWKSNGSAAGTKLVASVGNGDGIMPSKIVSCNGKLFFVINKVLWESDGFPSGTHAAMDTVFNNAIIDSYEIASSGNQLFFTAETYQYGKELYAGKINAPRINFISAANGNWNDPTTWEGNEVPPAGYNVIIRHNVTANINSTCNSLRVESPGHLTVNAGVNIKVSQ